MQQRYYTSISFLKSITNTALSYHAKKKDLQNTKTAEPKKPTKQLLLKTEKKINAQYSNLTCDSINLHCQGVC